MTWADEILRRWSLRPTSLDPRGHAASAATVTAVITAGGAPAVLKLTPTDRGEHALAAARRETAFYEHLAPRVGELVPTPLRIEDRAEGVALLLADVGPGRPVDEWPETAWVALAHGLARVHQLDHTAGPGFRHPRDLDAAMARPEQRVSDEFWASLTTPVADVRHAVRRELAYPSPFEPCFVHGDLHPDNVVMGAGRVHLLDWQECGLGSPLADLAFVNVRLAPTGRRAPDVFLDTYAGVRRLDRSVARARAELEELAVYLFQWPAYARVNPPAAVAAVRARAEHLAGVTARRSRA